MFPNSRTLLILATLLTLGCAKGETPVELNYSELGITEEESEMISRFLSSSDKNDVYKGLKFLQKNPKVTFIHLDQVIDLRENSTDRRISNAAANLLSQIRS